MSFISKVELKYQLEKMGIHVEGNYVRRKDLKKVLAWGSVLGGIDLVYKGIVFNDPMYEKEDNGHQMFWSDICPKCQKKYKNKITDCRIDDGSTGQAECLVEGCDYKPEDESDTGVVYIDFNTKYVQLRDRKTKKPIELKDL